MEAHLTDCGFSGILPDWHFRRRAAALSSDLRAVGADAPPSRHLALPSSRAALVGIAYVLEGSRLGGAVLAKRVAPDYRGVATAYLEHGAGRRFWPSFTATIGALAFTPAEQAEAVEAASRCFDLFERALVIPGQHTTTDAAS